MLWEHLSSFRQVFPQLLSIAACQHDLIQAIEEPESPCQYNNVLSYQKKKLTKSKFVEKITFWEVITGPTSVHTDKHLSEHL